VDIMVVAEVEKIIQEMHHLVAVLVVVGKVPNHTMEINILEQEELLVLMV